MAQWFVPIYPPSKMSDNRLSFGYAESCGSQDNQHGRIVLQLGTDGSSVNRGVEQ